MFDGFVRRWIIFGRGRVVVRQKGNCFLGSFVVVVVAVLACLLVGIPNKKMRIFYVARLPPAPHGPFHTKRPGVCFCFCFFFVLFSFEYFSCARVRFRRRSAAASLSFSLRLAFTDFDWL